MTYIGVVLDHKLNWNLHIQNKVSKTKKFLAMIRPAINYNWGLGPKRVQSIWKQIVLPRLTYAISKIFNQDSQNTYLGLLCSHVENNTYC